MNKTSMTYWFPRIQEAGVPVPMTEFVSMPESAKKGFFSFFDGEDGSQDPEVIKFMESLKNGANGFEYPLFLRTHLTSAKHSWKDSCFVDRADNLLSHVLEIIEYSELVDILGVDWSTWAIRELLPTTPAFFAFNQMPIVCEFRVFAGDGEVLCCHPYWPPMAIEGHTKEENWRAKLEELQSEPSDTAIGLAIAASKAVPGDSWSIDVLKTERGWFVTDMAIASVSFHWPGCDVINHA